MTPQIVKVSITVEPVERFGTGPTVVHVSTERQIYHDPLGTWSEASNLIRALATIVGEAEMIAQEQITRANHAITTLSEPLSDRPDRGKVIPPPETPDPAASIQAGDPDQEAPHATTS
jgi:hypothetical protein